jgi:formate dehydrogenase subunit gamma
MLRALTALLLTIGLSGPALAQYVDPDVLQAPVAEGASEAAPRASTGGATTLEDILARQSGEVVDDSYRSENLGQDKPVYPTDSPLFTRGGPSDSDLWRAMRYDEADIRTQNNGPASHTLIQDGGMSWLEFRSGPLLFWGAIGLGGTLAVLALFYLIRGKVKLDHAPQGRYIERFKAIERFAHWLLAASFITLGITGLLSLFGRKVFIPIFGHDAFAAVAGVTKWVHDNISWAFIIALVMIFVFWVAHNLPDRTDIKWILRGGGMFGGGHPPAKKFNAGQKLIFWSVIIFGTSISVSGLSMLFPFQINLFGHTFGLLNDIGAPGWFGQGPLPVNLAPQEEMQLAQLWHAILALVLTAIIFGHIYIGTLGMEGAFDAMGKGEVDVEWAREHHSIWAAEVEAETTPRRKV